MKLDGMKRTCLKLGVDQRGRGDTDVRGGSSINQMIFFFVDLMTYGHVTLTYCVQMNKKIQ